ncbi:MAG: histidine phosphatase family protein [Spirochaetaceae bacterium]|nr:MAG: histidine phosphatase family protein [Spirochaetaceae bacterium]
MRLLIIRHADPDYPNNTITPLGHREAEALSVRLAAFELDRIFSSPLGRAIDTAKYTADALGLEIEIEPWTHEIADARVPDGPDKGYVIWDLAGERLRDDPVFARCGEWWTKAPMDQPHIKSEVERIGRESDAFLARLGYERENGVYRVTRANTDKVAVFCHGGFGLTWLAHLLELPLPLVWSGMFLWPSSVTTVLFEQRSAEFAVPRCIGIADTSHLLAAGLSPTPSGLKANVE